MNLCARIVLVLLLFSACSKPTEPPQSNEQQASTPIAFRSIDASQSGIQFTNSIQETNRLHHYLWSSLYNGGGVALGDVNGDGLIDVFLTGNFVRDVLYINKGNLRFEDVSAQAGIEGGITVSSGVTMADVNGDGHLDIYVCKFGFSEKPAERRNLLYINRGDGTFAEDGQRYGLANTGYSVQASFFDMDKDGDLDMYLMNQPSNARPVRARYVNDEAPFIDENTSDRLFLNAGNNRFVDISEKAGIHNFAYGLGLVIADMNDDNWPDIYVANDYDKPDYLYFNNRNGTFTDRLQQHFPHTSNFSMGADIADINNDAHPDVFVLDMAGIDHYRSKTNMPSMRPAAFWANVDKGYHYQYMHNVLQLNNGNGSFSDIAYLSGLAKTDWSWSALLADFNNDQLKDLFVTNGIKKDIRNSDYVENLKRELQTNPGQVNIVEILNRIPSTPLSNFMFQNVDGMTFADVSDTGGFREKTFSNGAAYGDLDNDGDLDLIINNIDKAAQVYQNMSREQHRTNYVQLHLQSTQKRHSLMGTKVYLYSGTEQQFQELMPTRGFISRSDDIIHFGLGHSKEVDSIKIVWPDFRLTMLNKPAANKRHVVDFDKIQGNRRHARHRQTPLYFANVSRDVAPDVRHRDNDFDDYGLQVLLPYKMSELGPDVAVADVNKDGLTDLFLTGSAGDPSRLFLQEASGFVEAVNQPWVEHAASEDLGAHFFDANGDGHIDLYVACGGYEFPKHSNRYRDRLYVNDGKGRFTDASHQLPENLSSSRAVASSDVDGDGDMDLFVGGRLSPGRYPETPVSQLLIQDNGRFRIADEAQAPGLSTIGMVTDAAFADTDGDGDDDLIVVGEWMPIALFINDGGQFQRSTDATLGAHTGLWQSLAVADVNGDGALDLLAGNMSPNNKFKASAKKPFRIYANDFDANGHYDVVLASYYDGKVVPVRGRECSSEQLPFIAEKFPTFDGFAKASIEDILEPENLEQGQALEASELRSGVFLNYGNGAFTFQAFPTSCQRAPIRDFSVDDWNADGHLDFVAAGNLYGTEVETTRYDAGTGMLMLGDGQGGFEEVPLGLSGFFARKDARALATLKIADHTTIVVANHNDALQFFQQRTTQE